MNIRFEGKRALVTGAGKGIGYGIAKALAAGGAETTALSRTQEDLDRLKAENPAIRTVCVDLADWAATRKAVEDIGPVDLLVNNAGLSGGVSFLDTEEADLDRKFAVNVKAVVNVSQVVAKGMVARGQGGAVVNISSTHARLGAKNRTAYCASKGAVDQVTRVMALELGPHQIRVNSVNPTLVKTRMGKAALSDPTLSGSLLSRIPQGKFAEVEDVVHAVLYVLSDKADMVNGITLFVDGGLTAV